MSCKAFRFAVVLLVAAGLQPGAASAAARLEAQAAGVTSYVLDNGFKIILLPVANAATARVELLVKVGSKQEGYGETGMAHLLEHMLFKGAGRHADLKSALNALGATWNGTTTVERTNFFAMVRADPAKVDALIRLEADRFLRPTFSAADLASEMTVVRNELERKDSDPNSLVTRALRRQSYFWHGYGRPTIGARSDIEGAPFAALQAFHRRYYRPDNALLVVSGQIDAARVLAVVEAEFGLAARPDTALPGSWTRDEARPQTNRSELFGDTGKVIAASAWKLPGSNVRQTQAIDLASSALCAAAWGKLRRETVEMSEVAFGMSCNVDALPDYSLFVVRANAGEQADAAGLARRMHEQLEKVVRAGLSEAELERARNKTLAALARLGQSHEALAAQLAEAEVAGDWRLFFRRREILAELTLEEVNAALRTWLIDINRSDVLLRRSDGRKLPVPPPGVALSELVGRDWPASAASGDALPSSFDELAGQVVSQPLGEDGQAALLSRQTQGKLAWVSIANDYGNLPALNGRQDACALASSLLAQGGGGLSRDQLVRRLEALQARWSLGLGGLSLEAPRANIEAALDLLLAVWKSPRLPAVEFERLKRARLAQLQAARKDPARVAANAIAGRFDNYPAGHPYQSRSLAQVSEAVQKIEMDDIKACLADFGGRSQIRLAMVGDFSEADIAATWARLHQLPAAAEPYQRIAELAPPTVVDRTPIEVIAAERPNADVLGVALLAITPDAADYPALKIAVSLLGGGSDSRIRQRLREREGLAYSAGAALSGGDFGPRSRFSVSSSVASAQAAAALALLQEEVARALVEGFTALEVERAQAAWQEARAKSLASESALVGLLLQGMQNGHDFAWQAELDRRIARLTAPEVSAALRRHLAPAALVWSVAHGE
jgi:zinc protease